MITKFKRGYENGEQTIELYEGNIDLVLYNDKPHKPSFYFYRFPPEVVFGNNSDIEKFKSLTLVNKNEVEKFLKENGIDYGVLIERLLHTAWQNDMRMRDEM